VKTGMFIQKNKEGTGGWFTAMLIPPDNLKDQHGQPDKAILADVQLECTGINVTDVYPRQIPDLSAAKPVIITGRFTGTPTGSMTITGHAGGLTVRYDLAPLGTALESPAVGTVWARARLADLHEAALRDGRDIMQDVKGTALTYGLVSEYTSFVMVDTTHTTNDDAGNAAAVPGRAETGQDAIVQRPGN
jgi:Ca-activated chloride channel family protein